MISAIHPDSLEGYFETTNWCLKFLMFGWRVLYSEVTTKICGMFSTLFLYGFPFTLFELLFQNVVNFCKVSYILGNKYFANFDPFWTGAGLRMGWELW